MTTDLKMILDSYQNGLCTLEEFKRLVNCTMETDNLPDNAELLRECAECGEEFVSEKREKFCPMCEQDAYMPTQEEKDADEIEQEERHEPLEKAAEDVDFSDIEV